MSCAEVVETEKFQEEGSSSFDQSGDMQGAVVKLTGTVTEIEDVETGKKSIGLSVNDEEIVVLDVKDKKLYLKGELVQVEAKLLKKLEKKIKFAFLMF